MSFYTKFKGQVVKRKYQGKDRNVKEGRIDPDKVKFEVVDADKKTGNPRLWNMGKQLKQSKFIKGRFDENAIIKLAKGKNGFAKSIELLEVGLAISGEPNDPIILSSEGYCIEGSRRTIASRNLKTKGDERFNTIPCLVLSEEVTKEEMKVLVAQMHVAEKVQWKSIDRAATAYELYKDYDMDIPNIAKNFAWTIQRTKAYIETYRLILEYQEKHKDYKPKIFTFFYKVATNQALKNRMENIDDDNYDPELKDKFHTWVKNERINDCRHVAELIKGKYSILNYPRAITILEKHGKEGGSTKAIEWITKNFCRSQLADMADDLCDQLNKANYNDKRSKGLYHSLGRLNDCIELLLAELKPSEAA